MPSSPSASEEASPLPPQDLTLKAKGRRLVVTWAPAGDGEPIVDSYRLWFDLEESVSIDGDLNRYTVPALEPGSWHQVRLAAVNSGGQSDDVAAEVTMPDDISAAANPSIVEESDTSNQALLDGGSSSPEPTESAGQDSTRTLAGTFQVYANRNPHYPENCGGFSSDGLGDIQIGSQVTVRNGLGQTIGLGALANCKFTPMDGPDQARGFRFTFEVTGLPEADFYSVEVASRGEVSYSAAQLADSDWTVDLSLG